MGLFSSIGKVFKKVTSPVSSFFGSPLGDLVGDVGTSLLTGGLTRAGVEAQNAGNIASGREAAAFNAAEAQKNREFNAAEAHTARAFSQREARKSRLWSANLANTAHAREVVDLRRAGLNPILSSKYGGSATPPSAVAATATASGSAASRTPARIEDEIGPAVNSAQTNMRLRNETAMTESNIKLQNAQAETEKAKQEELGTRSMKNSTGSTLDNAHTRHMNQMEKLTIEKIRTQKEETLRTRKQTEKLIEETRTIHAQLRGLLVEEEIDNTQYGRVMRYINRSAPFAKNITDVLTGIRRLLPSRIVKRLTK
ncbi:DNA pilot protein [Microviridae sp.]|nr:DNA pilot protein [Microviridae sp.]